MCGQNFFILPTGAHSYARRVIPEARSTSPAPSRRELAGALLILFVFISINLVTATRTPTVYVDEPVYCDPAANLYFGSGFTSTMWGQPRDAFWCGNVPLYQGILWLWFKLAGFGFFQVRALNTLLTAAAGLLIWSALRRTSLVLQPGHRLLSLALILSGYMSALTFRTARPDATMFFVCALVFFGLNFKNSIAAKWILPCAASFFLPVAGIPMLPYIGLLLVLYLAFYRTTNVAGIFAVALGMLGGVAALACFYEHFASVRAFVEIILPFTSLGATGGHISFLRGKIFGDSFGGENLWTSFFGNPLEFEHPRTRFDYGAAILFAVGLALYFSARKTAGPADRRFMRFILAIALVVPPFMHFAGHYQSYYRWMSYLPLAMALPRFLEINRESAGSPLFRRAALMAMGLSILLGAPLRNLIAVPGWNPRSPAALEQVSAQVVQANDIVVADYKAWFALRPCTKLLYAYGLTARGDFKDTVDLPTNSVTLLCLFPENLATVTNRIGGNWQKISLDNLPGSAALTHTRYNLDFYRRAIH